MLSLSDVRFCYPGSSSPALNGASLSVQPGELLALMGANGSGKSTALSALCGAVLPQEGFVRVDGFLLSCTSEEHREKIRELVGYVGQDPDSRMVSSVVFDEVAFGPCNMQLSPDEVRKRVHEALQACECADLAGRTVSSLSGGQRQRVAIAAILAMKPRYILFDEPCSMLDAPAHERIRSLVSAAAQGGAGVVFATHDLEDALVCDRVAIMEAGRVVWEGSPLDLLLNRQLIEGAKCLTSYWTSLLAGLIKEGLLNDGIDKDVLLDPRGLVQKIAYANDHNFTAAGNLAALLREGANKKVTESKASASQVSGEVVLEHVCFGWNETKKRHKARRRKREPERSSQDRDRSLVLSDILLRIKAGEICLVSGPSGSGKTTLLKLCAGLLEASSGSVSYGDVPTSPANFACAFQRPADQLFAETVIQDVLFGPHNRGLSPQAADAQAREALRAVGIEDEALLSESPFHLSGGQARRVALAGVIACGTPFIALDEPTVGLDATGLSALCEILKALRARGIGVLVASHDVEHVAPLADRCYVLEGGALRPADHCSSQKLESFLAALEARTGAVL